MSEYREPDMELPFEGYSELVIQIWYAERFGGKPGKKPHSGWDLGVKEFVQRTQGGNP